MDLIMTNFYQAVKEFQRAVGQRVGVKPEFPDTNERNLRVNLLEEEYNEYNESENADDLVNLAKELADIIYIVCGTAVSYGIPLDKVFDEVHQSNMSKLIDGKPLRREDGKILKGPNYRPPNIEKILMGE